MSTSFPAQFFARQEGEKVALEPLAHVVKNLPIYMAYFFRINYAFLDGFIRNKQAIKFMGLCIVCETISLKNFSSKFVNIGEFLDAEI